MGAFSVAENLILDTYDRKPFCAGIGLRLPEIARNAAERIAEFAFTHATANGRKTVTAVIEQLKLTFEADYVVLGGGNAVRLDSLPAGVRLGDNRNAFVGGLRLWQPGRMRLILPGEGAAVGR